MGVDPIQVSAFDIFDRDVLCLGKVDDLRQAAALLGILGNPQALTCRRSDRKTS
jgi:hypothetical protein